MGFLLPSHIDQGVIFGILGLWHLFNTLHTFIKFPNTFTYRTWFPVTKLPGTFKSLELYLLLLVVIAFLFTQLSHVLPDIHHGFIQANHLQRFQHITFGMFFLVYILVALTSESCNRLPLPNGALHSLLALAFLMELLVFHLGHHPRDTLESFVHMLMQIVLAFLVSAMFLEILLPRSFMLSAARCMLLFLKGSWFFHIGLLINFRECAPEGCAVPPVGGGFPECEAGMVLMRAKSLQVLVFGWHVLGIVVVTVLMYAGLVSFYVGPAAKDHYQRLGSFCVMGHHSRSNVSPIDYLDCCERSESRSESNAVARSQSRSESNAVAKSEFLMVEVGVGCSVNKGIVNKGKTLCAHVAGDEKGFENPKE